MVQDKRKNVVLNDGIGAAELNKKVFGDDQIILKSLSAKEINQSIFGKLQKTQKKEEK